MKIHLLSLFCFLTVSFVKAQDYSNIQEKIGFLFADLPLFNSSELWLNQIQLRKDEFKDTSAGNDKNFNSFIIRDISPYSAIAPQINQVLLVLFNTPVKREDMQERDTSMGIRILIYLQPGISKKEAKENYKKIRNILTGTFKYSHAIYAGKSHDQIMLYSNKKFDAFTPLQSSFGFQKENNSYFINLYFIKLKNGGQSK